MEIATLPNESDLDLIKNQIREVKRKAEYEKLKKELAAVTREAVTAPTEFDGMMQIPDTDKVLKSERKKQTFVELLFARIVGMFAVRPIIGNVIALLIAGVVMFYIFHEMKAAGFGKYQAYFGIGIQLFAAIQVIKSGTRSLLLPFLALVVGSTVAHGLAVHHTLLDFDKVFYQHLMIVGIIGLGASILSID